MVTMGVQRRAQSGHSFLEVLTATAIFTTVIYSNDIGWRDFWLVVCVAGFVGLVVFLLKACEQF